jgi:hypothetical protein
LGYRISVSKVRIIELGYELRHARKIGKGWLVGFGLGNKGSVIRIMV